MGRLNRLYLSRYVLTCLKEQVFSLLLLIGRNSKLLGKELDSTEGKVKISRNSYTSNWTRPEQQTIDLSTPLENHRRERPRLQEATPMMFTHRCGPLAKHIVCEKNSL
jgi:hypothetical protein